MGIIRLTIFSIVGVGGAMLWFGRDDGLPVDRIGRERMNEPSVLVTAPLPTQAPPPIVVQPVVQPRTPTPVTTAPVITAPVITPTPTPAPIVVAPVITPTPAPVITPTAPAPQTVIPVLYVTGSKVNMRSGPSTDNNVVASLLRGTAVDFLGEVADGWSQITVINTGATGFMSSQFLSADQP